MTCIYLIAPRDTRVVESGDRPNAIPIVQEVPTPVSTDDNPRDRGNGSVDLGYSSVSGSNAFMGLQQVNKSNTIAHISLRAGLLF